MVGFKELAWLGVAAASSTCTTLKVLCNHISRAGGAYSSYRPTQHQLITPPKVILQALAREGGTHLPRTRTAAMETNRTLA